MTINYQHAVQKLRTAYVEAEYSDLASGTFVPLITLPPGAIIVDGGVLVITASNAGTSEKLEFGTSSDHDSVASVSDSTATGRTALTASTAPVSGATTLGLTRTAAGTAATAGKYGVCVVYAIAGASDATHG